MSACSALAQVTRFLPSHLSSSPIAFSPTGSVGHAFESADPPKTPDILQAGT